MAESPYKIASDLMTIDEACELLGMGKVSGLAKTYCPFGDIFHSDGGRERSFKVYPATNSAYCFACQRGYNPVSLIAFSKDISTKAAVDWILEYKEWVAPDWISQWDALATEKPKVDYEGLQEALKLACRRMDADWETKQFEPGVAAKLTQCLELVRKVQDNAGADRWFVTTKEAMRRVLASTKPTS